MIRNNILMSHQNDDELSMVGDGIESCSRGVMEKMIECGNSSVAHVMDNEEYR